MIAESDGILTLKKALSGGTELLLPQGEWASTKNSCIPVSPVLTAQATYYTTVDHAAESDDYDCTTALVCGVCGITIHEAKEHSLISSLTYANFCESGVYICYCENDGCIVLNEKDDSFAPMFTMLGYSITEVSIGGKGIGMVQGFYANSTAIQKYEEANGVKLSLGVVAASKSYVESNPLILNNGTVTAVNQNVLFYNNTNTPNDAFEIKITGINPENEAHLNSPLIWCGYVSDGYNIWYIDNGKTYKTAQSMSYNEALVAFKTN